MVQDHLGNEFKSEMDMIIFYNINPSTYKYRIRSGKTKKEALTTPVKPRSKKVTDHLGNEFDSESAMCKFYNISYATYRNRIRSGFSKEEALTTPVRSKRNLGGASANKSTNKQLETHYNIDHTLANNEKGVLLQQSNTMNKKHKPSKHQRRKAKKKMDNNSNLKNPTSIENVNNSNELPKTEDICKEVINDSTISSSTRLYILFKLCEKTICHNIGMHLYYALLDWKEHNINNIVVPEKYKKYL